MFKRKDEDIDLLSDAGGSNNQTNQKSEPAMTTTPVNTPTSTNQAAIKPAATPANNQGNNNSGMSGAPTGYTRPNSDTGTVSRPSAFRPTGNESARPASPMGRPTSDYRPSPVNPTSNPNASAAASNASNADKAKASGRRVLTVGHDILLKGEIATCDRLVIEGSVDATLNEVHTVEIAETGSFKGAAEIEDAEISGVFDGELIVRNRLVIYATGQVRGKITYGEIEIERGGELTGTIKSYKGESLDKKTKDAKDKKAA